jgi:hypothetical protein
LACYVVHRAFIPECPTKVEQILEKLVGADSTRTHWSSIGSHLMQSNQIFNAQIAYTCEWQPCEHSWTRKACLTTFLLILIKLVTAVTWNVIGLWSRDQHTTITLMRVDNDIYRPADWVCTAAGVG